MSAELVLMGSVVTALLVLGVGIFSTRRQQTLVDQRLGTLAAQNPYEPIIATEELEDDRLAKRERSAMVRKLDQALEKRTFGKKWRLQLSRADLKLTVGEFFATQFISMAAFFAVAYFIIFRADIIPSILAGAVGFFFPRIMVGRRISKRLIQFENQLADTLSLWVNALRSGYSVPQAMEAIGRDSPEPTRSEFRRVVQEMQLGISVTEALNHMLERVESEDLDLVVTAVNIQREVGGNLAEILDTVADTLRERAMLRRQIKVLTAEGRLSAWVLALLPVAIGLYMAAVNPSYIGLLVTTTVGLVMLGTALILMFLGILWMRKIVNIDV